MSAEEKPELNSPEQVDSASRRDFMKVAGVGALGLVYASPMVETLGRHHRDGPQGGSDPAGGGGGSNSSSSSSSSSSKNGRESSSSKS